MISSSKGQCVCEMTVDETHLNPRGTLHGGLIATLVDSISTLAIISAESNPGVSVDMNISYVPITCGYGQPQWLSLGGTSYRGY